MLAEDGSLGLTREQIQAEVDAQRADSERLAAERLRKLLQIPGFQHPVALSSLSDAQLTRLKAIFPQGVCDWTKPGVGQVPLAGTWLRY